MTGHRSRPIRSFWTEDEAEADADERGDCLIIAATCKPFGDVVCSVPAERSDRDIAATLADLRAPAYSAEMQRVLTLVGR